MLPITSTTTQSGPTIGNKVSFRKVRYKQARPYNLVLPYYVCSSRTHSYTKSNPLAADDEWLWSPGQPGASRSEKPMHAYTPWDVGFAQFDNLCVQVRNTARARFDGQLGPSAGIGINLVQWRQSLGMVSSRALQLYDFSRQLRRFNFEGAANTLGISLRPGKGANRFLADYKGRTREVRLKRSARAYGSNWLEFHFGWSPLVSDVYSAVDVLQTPLKDAIIRSSAKDSTVFSGLTYSDSNGNFNRAHHLFEVRVSCGARVAVTNPNLRLATQLGLTNPAVIAYDAIPFSFVLNWFVNVEQFLSSFTSTLGLSVIGTWKSESWKSDVTAINRSAHWSLPPPLPHINEVRQQARYFERTIGLPDVTLAARKYTGISATRALTSISLLIQKGLRT